MSTQEDRIAITSGKTQWYIVTARRYAFEIAKAINEVTNDDYALVRSLYRDWWGFLNTIDNTAGDACRDEFMNSPEWDK